MRLWTWQSVQVVKDLQEGDVWYSDEYASRRLKPYDEQYVENDKVPIYCFASIPYGNNKIPSVVQLVKRTSMICRFYDIDVEERILFELEVPEEEILRVSACDGDMVAITDKDKFLQSVRESDYIMEALIPYIKKEWIVMMACGKWSRDGIVIKYTPVVMQPKLYPSFTKEIFTAGDMKPRWSLNEKRYNEHSMMGKTNVITDEEHYFKAVGMHGAPGYFTISEALDSCDGYTFDYLAKIAKDFTIEDLKTKTIKEVLGGKEFYQVFEEIRPRPKR